MPRPPPSPEQELSIDVQRSSDELGSGGNPPLGITLRAGCGGCVVIVSVIPGSPAARSGLRVGDALLSVGKSDCKFDPEVAFDEVKRVWNSEEGSCVTFRVRRGGRGHGGRYFSSSRLSWKGRG